MIQKIKTYVPLVIVVCLTQNVCAQSALDGLIEEKQACQRVLEINSREAAARTKILNKIRDNNYAGLCKYGREIGYPGLLKGANRLMNTSGCRSNSDPYMNAVVERSMALAESNKRAVDRDCQRAGM